MDEHEAEVGAGLDAIDIELEPLRPRRRLRRAALALVPIAALGAGVLVVARSDGPPDPAVLLEGAATALADASSYHVDVATETHISSGTPGGVGSETTSRGRVEADVVGDDEHVRSETAEPFSGESFTTEYLRVDGRSFFKSDFPFDDSDGASQWIEVPEAELPDEAFVEEDLSWLEDTDAMGGTGQLTQFRLGLLLNGGFLFGDGAAQDLDQVSRLVLEAEDATYVEALPEGGDRITATLPPPEAYASLDPPLPTVEVTLDLDELGRPTRAAYRADEDSSWMAVEVTWSSWDAVTPLSAPGDDEIDLTPWIDEDALAALDPEMLLAPASPPDGLGLTSVSTYDDGDDCETLDLTYDAPLPDDLDADDFDDNWEYLYVTVTPVSCSSDDIDETAATDFGDGYVEIVIGQALVTLDSSLDAAALEAVAASMAPVTVDELSARAEGGSGAGWYAYAAGVSSSGFAVATEVEAEADAVEPEE